MNATIVMLPGDGIGPEIVLQARRVLEVIARRFGHSFEMPEHLIGGCAIDACGDPLPGNPLHLCRARRAACRSFVTLLEPRLTGTVRWVFRVRFGQQLAAGSSAIWG